MGNKSIRPDLRNWAKEENTLVLYNEWNGIPNSIYQGLLVGHVNFHLFSVFYASR